ncbi:MAG: hypothetical protein J2P17_10150, partial [Mycobacterium sp.]|nr:hypothetical protein [Mycobacterium sp.]
MSHDAETPNGHEDLGTVGAFRLTDKAGRQRLLATTEKPPAIINGVEMERGGDDGTYVVFNDENGSEKGGITASSTGAMLGLDYPNHDAIHLESAWDDTSSRASLLMTHMPDRNLPEDQQRGTLGVSLHCSSVYGSGLQLCDSQGRPRIVLQAMKTTSPASGFLTRPARWCTAFRSDAVEVSEGQV